MPNPALQAAGALACVLAALTTASAADLSGRPAHCPPRLWCGCYLAHEMGITGPEERRLWWAPNWATIGRPVARADIRPGDVVVWSWHVGRIVELTKPGFAIVRSGNDGGAVRTREVAIYNAFAFRRLDRRIF